MIDSGDRDRIDEAKLELERILADREMKDCLLMVFANKQDLPGGASVCLHVFPLGDRPPWFKLFLFPPLASEGTRDTDYQPCPQQKSPKSLACIKCGRGRGMCTRGKSCLVSQWTDS